jgi:hypothetical protein
MILSKKDSLKLIYRRLDSVSEALASLDGHIASKDALQKTVATLEAIEVGLLAEDETNARGLAEHRAELDLTRAKLERQGKTVALAEEVAVRAAEVVSQLIYAFKQGAMSAYYEEMERKTNAYFDERDLGFVRQLSSRSPLGRSIIEHVEDHFIPSSLPHRESGLQDARRLALTFQNLEDAAKGLDVQIDIPPQWLDDVPRTASVPVKDSGNKLGALA